MKFQSTLVSSLMFVGATIPSFAIGQDYDPSCNRHDEIEEYLHNAFDSCTKVSTTGPRSNTYHVLCNMDHELLKVEYAVLDGAAETITYTEIHDGVESSFEQIFFNDCFNDELLWVKETVEELKKNTGGCDPSQTHDQIMIMLEKDFDECAGGYRNGPSGMYQYLDCKMNYNVGAKKLEAEYSFTDGSVPGSITLYSIGVRGGAMNINHVFKNDCSDDELLLVATEIDEMRDIIDSSHRSRFLRASSRSLRTNILKSAPLDAFSNLGINDEALVSVSSSTVGGSADSSTEQDCNGEIINLIAKEFASIGGTCKGEVIVRPAPDTDGVAIHQCTGEIIDDASNGVLPIKIVATYKYRRDRFTFRRVPEQMSLERTQRAIDGNGSSIDMVDFPLNDDCGINFGDGYENDATVIKRELDAMLRL